jgi:hypothetical protein
MMNLIRRSRVDGVVEQGTVSSLSLLSGRAGTDRTPDHHRSWGFHAGQAGDLCYVGGVSQLKGREQLLVVLGVTVPGVRSAGKGLISNAGRFAQKEGPARGEDPAQLATGGSDTVRREVMA